MNPSEQAVKDLVREAERSSRAQGRFWDRTELLNFYLGIAGIPHHPVDESILCAVRQTPEGLLMHPGAWLAGLHGNVIRPYDPEGPVSGGRG